ncbi:MmgE/PrpD family protein [Novosphingobium mathurense]|uniref:2-methylcitrate dehydratase PrpD n=1 Tax=Novosphingobium mathurense TaxID=428990 RepID=A0A1U6IR44_9SPHN|nr:MmgE/PrpD family protein [Novosphingobium mathurense]SLK10511.1 2-methylcitrate dehydratase PrpD [Novosphingobium mathurense]
MPGIPDHPGDRLCQWVADLAFGDLPETTVAAARRVLLDASGVMLAASGLSPEVRPFIALAAGEGPCSLLGTGKTASPQMAAFANGAMAHALDYEDAFDRAPGHPNASLVPALLALSQSLGAVDGERFLVALVAGCEVSCRLGLALRKPMEAGGWYPPPILAGIGAAVGAARLLGCSPRQVRSAISLAMCQVTMPGEIKHSAGTVIRAVREAFPAQASVQAAQLARADVAGFERPLEGTAGFFALYAGGEFDPRALAGDLGRRFCIEELTFKPWPSCRGTHPFIEMALALRDKHALTPEEIRAIHVGIDDVQRMLTEPPERKAAPATVIDAKFSIPFTVALAIARGGAGLDDFCAATLADPCLLALAGKVVAVPDWQSGSHLRGVGGSIRIELADGRSLSAACATALGSPEMPLSEAQLVDKFIDCAARAEVPLPPDAANTLADSLLTLETCQDVGQLFA